MSIEDEHVHEDGHSHRVRGNGSVIEGWDVVTLAEELAGNGEEFALATVVWRQPPSSGQQGSRAIVTAAGELYGWIGGACTEPTVIREAKTVIAARTPKLLLLGSPGQFGDAIPDGIAVRPITCLSEGALEVYIEPVVPTPRVVVVGRSPMAQTLVDLSKALGWRAELVAAEDFGAADVDAHSAVIVATQGHGDELALDTAVAASPGYVGLVASRKRAEGVLAYLAEQGVPRGLLDRVHAPVGIDLGHTTHREIAVAVLAELVQRRAAGELADGHAHDHTRDRETLPLAGTAEAVDPVCGMTVAATAASFPYDYDGTTYYFCRAGCRTTFEKNPASFLEAASC